jgi:hypothetical protein
MNWIISVPFVLLVVFSLVPFVCCGSTSSNRPINAKTIRFNQRFSSASRSEVYEAVVNYLFRQGGGFGPPPRIIEAGEVKSGRGLLREVAPIGLRERILEAKQGEEFTYTVENPSPFMYPTDYHLGTFSFSEGRDGATTLTWTIDYLPMKRPLAGFLTRKISQTIGQIYLGNLAKYLNEDAKITETIEK